MSYAIQEGTLALSVSDDRSVNILAIERAEGAAVHLVISRDDLLPGEDLAASVDRQLKVAARQMQGFKEISRGPQAIGPAALPALVLETQFRQSNQRIYQAQAAIQLPNEKVIVFTLNSPAPFDDALRALWNAVLAGFVPAAPATPVSA